jgi:hypothetical protein
MKSASRAWIALSSGFREPVQTGIVTGICCPAAGSGGGREGEQLQEIVDGADHGPLGHVFSMPRNKN